MIGALSLVMVVWLGTSVSVSRRSTLTGRSTIGMRKRRPGSRTIDSLVLPRRNTTMRSYCCTTRTDRYRITSTTTRTKPRATRAATSSMWSSSAQGLSAAGTAVMGSREVSGALVDRCLPGGLHQRGQLVEADEADRGLARQVAPVRRPGRPRLAGQVHRAGRVQRRLDDAHGAQGHPVPQLADGALHAPCPDRDDGDQSHEETQRTGSDDEDDRRDLHHRVAGRHRAGVQHRGAEHDAHEPRRRSGAHG